MENSLSIDSLEGLIAATPEMRGVFQDSRKIAETLIPVLISGELGVGRRSLATAIHKLNGGEEKHFMIFADYGGEKKTSSVDIRAVLKLLEKGNAATLYIEEIANLSRAEQFVLEETIRTILLRRNIMKSYYKIIVGIVFLSLIFGVSPAFCQEESKEEIANQIKKREKDLEEYKKIESRLKHYLDPENDFFFLKKRDSYIPIRIEDKQKLMEDIKNMAYTIKSLSNISKKDLDLAVVMIQMEIEAEHDAIQRRLKDDLGVIRENIKAVNKDIERLKDKERKVALSKPSGEVSGPWVKGSAIVGRDPVDQIAGAWSFGRIVDKKKVFLCNLTLTKELTDKGYVIKSCHRNESFWEMDGTTAIKFKNKNGEVTSTLNRINDKYWEGEYHPPEDMPVKPGETIRPHYIERQ